MTIWSSEIRELEKLHPPISYTHPKLDKELLRLISADDENMALVYARRCLELIISHLCECELNRPRGSEPLKGIIDKLNREEKVPHYIIVSMNHINSISAFGAHPKEFDPAQVKPVLLDLATTLRWYMKYSGYAGDPSVRDADEPKRKGTVNDSLLNASFPESVEVYEGSIAVLPFQDMSPQKDQEYFCDGISEEIINALTRVERLKVIARTSAFAFKGRQMDIREIGNVLNVAHILEGSIRKDGNKVRITAQLIRVEDGSHQWSDTFDRELKDIFLIQDEISMTIVEKLKMTIPWGAKGGITKRHTENPGAYQYYLKGLYYWQMMTPEGNRKAQENYHKAIETDPEYALVYSVLGSNFLFAGISGFIPPHVSIENAREYTNKALEIDDTIVAAYSTLGGINLFHDWDLKAAGDHFFTSVRLNPNTAWDRFFYGWYLRTIGRFDEAIAESLIALEKDPFNIYIGTEVGLTFLKAGRVDESIERQKRIIDQYPGGFLAHQYLGEALEAKGLLEEAAASYEKAVALSNGNPIVEAKLACAWHRAGKEEEARSKIQQVEQIMKAAYVPPSSLIPYYLISKDPDRAFQWFNQACEERDLNLTNLLATPIQEYRMPGDPRFHALLEKTGLIDYVIS